MVFRVLSHYVPLYNMLVLSIGATLFFGSFSTTQATLSTIHKDVGYYSLALLYLTFALGNLIAPLVETLLGAKTSLIVGSVPYVLFVLSAGVPWESVSRIVLLVFGATLGLAASLFWVSQGDFIVRNARHPSSLKSPRLGLFSGIFFSIFSLNGLVGNLLNGVMSTAQFPKWLLFSILALVALLGVVLLLFLIPVSSIPPPPPEEQHHVQSPIAPSPHSDSNLSHSQLSPQASPVSSDWTSTLSSNSIFDLPNNEIRSTPCAPTCCRPLSKAFTRSLSSLVRLFFDRRMLLFTPISFYSGASLGFFQGNLPPLFGEKWLPWVMAVFSLCSGINAIIVGKLSDRIGKRIMMCYTFFVHFIALVLTFSIPHLQPFSFFWTMALCGCGDDSLNTMAYSYLGSYFRTAEGFALFKLVQSIGSGLSFFGGSLLVNHFHVIQWIMIGLWLISAISFFFLEFVLFPVDQYAKKFEDGTDAEEDLGQLDISFETYGSSESAGHVTRKESSSQHEM